MIEMIKEKEKEIGQEESGLRECKEDDDEIDNIQNPYEEL